MREEKKDSHSPGRMTRQNVLVLLLVCLLPVLFVVLPAHAGVLSPDLESIVPSLRDQDEISVIVTLSEKANLGQAGARDKAGRRAWVVRTLKDKADLTQKPLRGFLEGKKARKINPLWLINGLAAIAPAAVIRELADFPGVAEIKLDRMIQPPVVTHAVSATPEWNLNAIRVPELWTLGATGAGVVVANMDTGVDLSHPDLQGKWRGGTNGWFDPHGEHAAPFDAHGHGTQTMGIMVGGDNGGTAIGVAPNAKWVAVKIFNDAGEASYSAIHQGFQWLLDPDGNPDTDDAPDVLSNSWGLDNVNTCSLEFQPDIEVLKAAGIAVVFAAGNDGPGLSTSTSPANNPQAFAIGSVDQSYEISIFSSQGPSACDGAIYPVVVAPGDAIRTTDLTSGGLFPDSYSTVSGTSFAAPHVAGAMALLLSVFPGLSVSDLHLLLSQSAFDLGFAGPDNIYGYGLVDAAEAYSLLLSPLPDIAISPSSFTFAMTKEGGFSPPQTFTVTNQGLANLVIDGVSLTGSNVSEFLIENDGCSGIVLLPSETCTLEAIFSPGSPGAKNAVLSVSSNDPDENPFLVSLFGTGTEMYEAITVLSPNGGEIISSGATVTIRWGAPSRAIRFKLAYSVNNGRTWHLIEKNATGSSFDWQAPAPGRTRPRTFIKVIGYSAAGRRVGTDRSDSSFTIESGN
jgi:subtilisin family serine protease